MDEGEGYLIEMAVKRIRERCRVLESRRNKYVDRSSTADNCLTSFIDNFIYHFEGDLSMLDDLIIPVKKEKHWFKRMLELGTP